MCWDLRHLIMTKRTFSLLKIGAILPPLTRFCIRRYWLSSLDLLSLTTICLCLESDPIRSSRMMARAVCFHTTSWSIYEVTYLSTTLAHICLITLNYLLWCIRLWLLLIAANPFRSRWVKICAIGSCASIRIVHMNTISLATSEPTSST